MSLQPRPELNNLKACPHGGIDYSEVKALGLSPGEILDFSVCSNPYKIPEGIRKSINTIDIAQYPDPDVNEFRQRLSQKLGLSPDNILAGNGVTELIRLISMTYFRQDDSILILEPSFGEYEVACHIAGAKPVKQWMELENNFTPKITETINLIKKCHPRGVFICNPNNPTGKYLSKQEIEMILAAREDTLFILDEAYINFVDNSWSALDLIKRNNVIILRSMTKDYALAGLRLGYAIANQEIIENIRLVRPPWNVNTIAQKIGIIALDEVIYLEQSKKQIKQAKQFLIDELCQLDFQPLPSDTHFFLVRVGNATSFRLSLLKNGILVRDCTSFGLPEYIRIAPRTMPECQQLITTIQKQGERRELHAGI